MRAGTSRGPFFLREWLPEGDEARDQALIGAIGASDPLQLDGVGGGSTLNSKVAIVSRSSQPGCDVDYLFAQVGVGHRSVDTRPNCGNMLSGVAPFAIEQGLVTDDAAAAAQVNKFAMSSGPEGIKALDKTLTELGATQQDLLEEVKEQARVKYGISL